MKIDCISLYLDELCKHIIELSPLLQKTSSNFHSSKIQYYVSRLTSRVIHYMLMSYLSFSLAEATLGH